MIDDAVHDKHGSVLVFVGFVALAIETQNAEAGGTIEDSVACTDSSRLFRFFPLSGACTETRNKYLLLKIKEFDKY